jgi:hypothetical protein
VRRSSRGRGELLELGVLTRNGKLTLARAMLQSRAVMVHVVARTRDNRVSPVSPTIPPNGHSEALTAVVMPKPSKR